VLLTEASEYSPACPAETLPQPTNLAAQPFQNPLPRSFLRQNGTKSAQPSCLPCDLAHAILAPTSVPARFARLAPWTWLNPHLHSLLTSASSTLSTNQLSLSLEHQNAQRRQPQPVARLSPQPPGIRPRSRYRPRSTAVGVRLQPSS
jgi:hypothetical protein